MPAEGYTVSELAEKSKKTRHAVEAWLSLHKIKPLSYEAIYPPDTLDKIMEAKVGRPAKKSKDPPKAKPEAPDKTASETKAKKTKK
jgi:hypothetical protein